MCAILPVMLAVGAGMSLYSQSVQHDSQQDMADYQAKVAANNQTIAQQNQQNAIDQEQNTLHQQQIKNATLLNNAKAQMASNGLDLSMGTPLNVQNSDIYLGNLDSENIRNNAVNQIYGMESQNMNTVAQNQLNQYKSDMNDTNYNMGLLNFGLGKGLSGVQSLLGPLTSSSIFQAAPISADSVLSLSSALA
jgi:hypothetical protein